MKTGDFARQLRKVGSLVYGYVIYRKRFTYAEACVKLNTPFKMSAYQSRWCKYRENEPNNMNRLSPEEVWSDKMLDPKTGKHWDDCDGYAAMAIDPLTRAGYKCALLHISNDMEAHATCVIETEKQRMTICTYGLWCHGSASDVLLQDIAEDFLTNVNHFSLMDRNWKPMIEAHKVADEWEITDLQEVKE